MESPAGAQINMIPKMVKMMSHRTGRYFYKPVEEYPNILTKPVQAMSVESGLHNPIVLASVASGVLGVVIVIILIFTIWIRRRCYTTNNGFPRKIEYSTSELNSSAPSSTKSSIINDNFPNSKTSTETPTITTVVTVVDERPMPMPMPTNEIHP